MHDDQIRGLLRTLEEGRDPDPAFADALFGRLEMVARGAAPRRSPFLLLAAALLLATLAATLAVGSGLLRLPVVVDASASPDPSASAVALASASPSPASSASAGPSASVAPVETAAPINLAGGILFAEADGLRMRAEPSEAGELLATLRRGQLMGATGETAEAGGMTWYEVRIGPGALAGWVAGGPDGEWLRLVADGGIAFSTSGFTQADARAWVLATPLGDDALRSLAGEDVIDLVWSPDGTRLAIMTVGGDGRPAVDVADADGSNRREVGPGGYGAAWSPDGARLAWSVGSDLVVTDEALIPSALGTNLRGVGNPLWSPDGSRLALEAMDCPECPEDEPIVGDIPGAVYVVDIASGLTTKVTDPGYYDLAGWSADVTRLSIATYDLSGELPQQAFVVPTDGGGLSVLLDGAAVHEAARWSPDGSRLAVATPEGLVVMAGDGSAASVLVASDVFVGGARWSPSGQWLTYQTADGSDLGLWIVPADGSEEPRRFTSTDESAGMAQWQPYLEPLR